MTITQDHKLEIVINNSREFGRLQTTKTTILEIKRICVNKMPVTIAKCLVYTECNWTDIDYSSRIESPAWIYVHEFLGISGLFFSISCFCHRKMCMCIFSPLSISFSRREVHSRKSQTWQNWIYLSGLHAYVWEGVNKRKGDMKSKKSKNKGCLRIQLCSR